MYNVSGAFGELWESLERNVTNVISRGSTVGAGPAPSTWKVSRRSTRQEGARGFHSPVPASTRRHSHVPARPRSSDPYGLSQAGHISLPTGRVSCIVGARGRAGAERSVLYSDALRVVFAHTCGGVPSCVLWTCRTVVLGPYPGHPVCDKRSDVSSFGQSRRQADVRCADDREMARVPCRVPDSTFVVRV